MTDTISEAAAAVVDRLPRSSLYGIVERETAITLITQLIQSEVERRPAENEQMSTALKLAGEWFQQYADSHTAKGDTDKAQRNQDRADFCAMARKGRDDE